MEHFYWDLFYIGNGNEQRKEWQDSLVCPFDSLPLSQTALAGLKPTDHPAAASWVLQHTVHTIGAVRTTINRYWAGEVAGSAQVPCPTHVRGKGKGNGAGVGEKMLTPPGLVYGSHSSLRTWFKRRLLKIWILGPYLPGMGLFIEVKSNGIRS